MQYLVSIQPTLQSLNGIQTMQILRLSFLMLMMAGIAAAADRPEISADELAKRMNADDKPLILDVRSPEEYKAGHLIGATLIPFKEISDRIAELGDDKSREIVVYCQSGRRAGIAEKTLRKAGFTNVLHLKGDWGQWSAEKRPFIKEAD